MKQAPNADTFQQRKDTFLRRGRLRWPYIKYVSYLAQPSTLASAGFSFSPAKDAPDNVQCFNCGFELTGWEPSDDPFAEHYAHQPTCTYAKLHCQARVAREGDKVEWTGWPVDTTAEWQGLVDMRNDAQQMRLATFEGCWPHTGRKDWNVTPDKLASAGFYYTPEWPGDDTATCVFCGYALAEWEPEDEPNTEHARRAPDCLFFKLDSVKPQVALPASPQVQPSPQPRRISVRASRESETPAAVAEHVEAANNDSDSSAASKRPRLSIANNDLTEDEKESEGQQLEEIEDDVDDVDERQSEAEDHETPVTSLHNDIIPAVQPFSPLISPAEMNVDETYPATMNVARLPDDTQATTQVEGTDEEPGREEDGEEAWDLTEEEERMTVEEFIRACCDQKIASLEASAAQMVSAFMQRAESTRDRIRDMTW
ncbi:hypothetical protein IWW38_002582 [Coemansia aciculifera]|uniref:Uncharacterized protein n=1 Tax=Coemansia aciculifera TaxID=417176 RepID=A0ACC1M347_9FUNG|nr:hypothetical protein IWW38_002582 [Coemansia aciculifera]